jgi:phosphatidylglycerophosphatase A
LAKTKLKYPSAGQLFSDPQLLLAFGLGSGLSRIVPGTCGTLAALPIWYLMSHLPLWAYCLVLVLSTLWGVHLCGYAARKLGVHDHGGIVWDEFVGMWISLLWIPVEPVTVLIAFICFRVFDMLKPWPISLADRKLGGGFGIMIDDVLAGFAALACTHAILYFFMSGA